LIETVQATGAVPSRGMSEFRDLLRRLLRGWEEESASLTVYALFLAFIAIVVVAALIFLGPVTSQVFQDTQCLRCT
jgi:hypothetical protein